MNNNLTNDKYSGMIIVLWEFIKKFIFDIDFITNK